MSAASGRRTGTCRQRCVGLDAIGSCHPVTFDVDAKNGGSVYHQRFLAFLERAQAANIVGGGAMTDPKSDRSKPPHQQAVTTGPFIKHAAKSVLPGTSGNAAPRGPTNRPVE